MNFQSLTNGTKIILASASPRRQELLSMIGVDFEVIASNCDEFTDETEPHKIVQAIAQQKASSVAKSHPGRIVLGADTVVAIDGKILGKPHNAENAKKMLRLLSGKCHSVYTGICLVKANGEHVLTSVRTDVYFKKLTDSEIEAYVRTEESFDKAGGYAAQGLGAVFVDKIYGDFFNVIGLPISTVYDMFKLHL